MLEEIGGADGGEEREGSERDDDTEEGGDGGEREEEAEEGGEDAEEYGMGGMEERTAEAEAVVARARGGRTDSRDAPDCSGSAPEPRPNPASSRSIGGGAAVGAGRESLGKWMWSRPWLCAD